MIGDWTLKMTCKDEGISQFLTYYLCTMYIISAYIGIFKNLWNICVIFLKFKFITRYIFSLQFQGDFWARDKNSDPFVMVLKNRYELCEDLKYVISVPDLCDVLFLVGPEKTPVYGIRAILATRSRYYFTTLPWFL